MQGKSVLTETGRINLQVLTSVSFVRDTMQLMKKPAHSLSHIIYLSPGLIPVPPISNPDKRCDYAQKWARWSVTTNSDSSQQINQIFWPRPIGIDWIWMPFNNVHQGLIIFWVHWLTQLNKVMDLENIIFARSERNILRSAENCMVRNRVVVVWWWEDRGRETAVMPSPIYEGISSQ